jgi:hypothetical protein
MRCTAQEIQERKLKLGKRKLFSRNLFDETEKARSARAAMAHPLLFKPFKHKASKKIYSNQEHGSNVANPIAVASSELKAIWGSSPSALLDIVVSLGSGFSIGQAAVTAGSEKFTISSDTARTFTARKRKRISQLDQQCEKAWKNYLQTLPGSSASVDSYIRLNIRAVELPAIDDISSSEDLRNMVQTQIPPKAIRILTSRLIAKLFYFEKIGEMEMMPGNDLFLRGTYLNVRPICGPDTLNHIGEILCRIPDGTPEISEIGKLLMSGSFQSSELIVQEHLCKQQYLSIPLKVIEDMIHHLRFHMPEVIINVSERYAEFNITLRLKNKEEYSISGFPRFLVGKEVQTRSKLSLLYFTSYKPF